MVSTVPLSSLRSTVIRPTTTLTLKVAFGDALVGSWIDIYEVEFFANSDGSIGLRRPCDLLPHTRSMSVSVFVSVSVSVSVFVFVCAFAKKKKKKVDGNARPLCDRNHVIFSFTRDPCPCRIPVSMSVSVSDVCVRVRVSVCAFEKK